MAFPVERGGIGFDYRMSMGIADYWMKIVKERKDEEWSVGEMFFKMTDHRKEERVVSYVESHDQAMVGDKTLIFRLIDKEMYTSMSIFTPNLVVDRGVALHKMIRLLTLSLSGGGYLNFMGNEFGHPEWIDFPRAGNNWSYQHARRQWSLADNTDLKYHALNEFDKAMVHLITEEHCLQSDVKLILQNEGDQVLAFSRGNCLFVFNFSPDKSYADYGIECPSGDYKIVLDTDDPNFAGFGNVDHNIAYTSRPQDGKTAVRLY